MTWSGGLPASAAYEVGKAADLHARDRFRGPCRADLALGQAALERALVTEHQQHAVLGGHPTQALADRIPRSQQIGVVVKEEHADDLDAMRALLQLRKDHLPELVAGRVAGGGEHVGDLHPGGRLAASRAHPLPRWRRGGTGGGSRGRTRRRSRAVAADRLASW